jgi:hypothetical protein
MTTTYFVIESEFWNGQTPMDILNTAMQIAPEAVRPYYQDIEWLTTPSGTECESEMWFSMGTSMFDTPYDLKLELRNMMPGVRFKSIGVCTPEVARGTMDDVCAWLEEDIEEG